ncbi:uncharacterized protein Pyn_07582 [Prunus yedoensis var. nudiflora]|uniref:Uncharacterized protein n=1 Tax=Prunus yedoensis var. nudiflora TaxID=2094558 RepID=A0A314XHY3_PRUYE|nr:uncharacterized protein Pyn_07582 [Prunus yedoensis var. nudiflora]
MKFLLELGSCYRSSSSKQTQDHEMIRSRVRRSKSAESAQQWRPALVPISEDGVASGHEGKVQSEKISSKKGRKAKARSLSSISHDELSGGNNVSVFVPAAFAATPFMF